MNETIGEKGKKNDYLQTLKNINRQKEEKEAIREEELKREEKELKKNQLLTLIATMPLVIPGNILANLLNQNKETKHEPSKTYQEQNKELNVIITTPKYIKESTVSKKQRDPLEGPFIKIDQSKINIPETQMPEDIEKLKEHEIVERYYDKFRKIRKSLNDEIIEYNNIYSEYSANIYSCQQAHALLERLDILIKKIRELKTALEMPDVANYDWSYINKYIALESQDKLLEGVKDSALYLLISNKLEELSKMQESLTVELEDRKKKLLSDKDNLDTIEKQYDDFSDTNDILSSLKQREELLEKDLKMKLKVAITNSEKMETNSNFKLNQAMLLTTFLLASLNQPKIKPIVVATLTHSLLAVMTSIINQKDKKENNVKISVTDYSKEIINSIESIEDAINKLLECKADLEETIKKFRKDYKEYLGKVKEYDNLLEKLEEVEESLNEREKELEGLKDEREEDLNINNQKVKQIMNNN